MTSQMSKRDSFFVVVLIFVLLQGCGGSRESTAPDETFFKPLTALPPRPRPEPAVTRPSAPVVATASRADTVLNALREQDRRLKELTKQFLLLESVRKGDIPDSMTAPDQRPAVAATESAPSSAGDERRLIADADRLFQAGEYRQVIDFSREQLRTGAHTSVEDRLNFLVGASHYHLRQFDLASVFLKRALESPALKKGGEVQFMLGRTYLQLGMTDRARVMFEAALGESPPARLAASLREELQRLGRKR